MKLLLSAALALFPLAALANTGDTQSSEQYLRDKDYAVHKVNKALQQQCLNDVTKKIGHEAVVNSAGKLLFDDHITQTVYQQFYWNDSDRGVAFIMPVQAHDKQAGDISTNVACFYSLTKNGLEFQLSQQIRKGL